jgi:hypothetical protein
MPQGERGGMTTPRRDDGSLDDDLSALHDSSVWRVNAAVAAGREDLAREVADDYPDAALRLVARGGR